MEAEGKMPRAPMAGGLALGDVVGLGCSISGLDAYAESVASPALGLGDVVPLSVSVVGVCSSFADSTSCDCFSRNFERASMSVACGSLSSSKIAFDSASISTGAGGGTALRGMGMVDDRGVLNDEIDCDVGKFGGGRPGEPIGDGGAEAAAEGAAEPWKRNTLAKSVIFDLFVDSDFPVPDFLSVGILSTWIGGGFFAPRMFFVDFVDFADLADLTEPVTDFGAWRGSS